MKINRHNFHWMNSLLDYQKLKFVSTFLSFYRISFVCVLFYVATWNSRRFFSTDISHSKNTWWKKDFESELFFWFVCPASNNCRTCKLIFFFIFSISIGQENWRTIQYFRREKKKQHEEAINMLYVYHNFNF